MAVCVRDDGDKRIVCQREVMQTGAKGFLKADKRAVQLIGFQLFIDVRNTADVDNDIGAGVNFPIR